MCTQHPNITAGLSLVPACQESSVSSRRTCEAADTYKMKKQLLLFGCQLFLKRPGNFRSPLCVSSEGTNSVLCCHIPQLPRWMFYSTLKSVLRFSLLLCVDQYQKGIYSHQQSDPLREAPSWQEKPLHLFF